MTSLVLEAFETRPYRSRVSVHEAALARQLTSLSWNNAVVSQVYIASAEEPNALLGYDSPGMRDCGASFTTISNPTSNNSKWTHVSECSTISTPNWNLKFSSCSGFLVMDSLERHSTGNVQSLLHLQQWPIPLALLREWYASLLSFI